MPLSHEHYTGHEDYARFGATVSGALDSFLKVPPHKRTPLAYARLIDQLSDLADQAGVVLRSPE